MIGISTQKNTGPQDGSWSAYGGGLSAVGATAYDAIYHLARALMASRQHWPERPVRIIGGDGDKEGGLTGTPPGTTLADLLKAPYAGTDSETHDAAVAAHQAAMGRTATLHLTVKQYPGRYEAQGAMGGGFWGRGSTPEEAIRDAARRHGSGVYTPSSYIEAIDHEGNPLPLKTIAQWAA